MERYFDKEIELHVLILVLMEDTLRELLSLTYYNNGGVLILVLMEDTLRVFRTESLSTISPGLNPCFNGRYSQRGKSVLLKFLIGES